MQSSKNLLTTIFKPNPTTSLSKDQLKWHVDDLASLNADLRSTISTLTGDNRSTKTTLANLEKRNKSLRDELLQARKEACAVLEEKSAEQEATRCSYESEIERLRGEVVRKEEEEKVSQGMLDDANALIGRYQSAYDECERVLHGVRQEKEILGAMNEVLNRANESLAGQLEQSETAVARMREESVTMKEQNAYLQEKVTWYASVTAPVNENMFDTVRNLRIRCVEAEASLLIEKQRGAILELSIETLQAENTALEVATAELPALKELAPSSLRSLVLMRMGKLRMTEEVENGEQQEARMEEQQNSDERQTLQYSLDVPLSVEKLQKASTAIDAGVCSPDILKAIKLKRCCRCKKDKFCVPPKIKHKVPLRMQEITEVTTYSPCCHKVCNECFVEHLSVSVKTDWWFNLGSLQFIKCPKQGCKRYLNIRTELALSACLRSYGATNVDSLVSEFATARVFRRALEALQPRPEPKVLEEAATLYTHLMEQGKMYSIFDRRFKTVGPDEDGITPELPAGVIVVGDTERHSGVPVFTKLLRRQAEGRTCSICCRTKYEVDHGSPEEWKRTCEGFAGSWMWAVLSYPTKEILKCRHEIEICRECIATHLETTLETKAAAACDQLKCPCGQSTLSYEEVRSLATAETFAKYERYLLLTVLSADPNFRWCLNPTPCPSGQIHAPHHHPRGTQKITCSECRHEACFTCQTAWHRGLTCEQAKSQREHGDPRWAETQRYLRENTRGCPREGCGVAIEKGDGCFHMTCRQCKQEFCWECLADWGVVRQKGRNGHKEGCYFRANNFSPSGMRGRTLNEAIRARDNAL